MHKWNGFDIDTDQSAISSHLSQQLKLLGLLLGHSIKNLAGDHIFQLFSDLHLLCRRANQTQNDEYYKNVKKEIEKLSREDIIWLIKTYTVFFHLQNEAERQEITRINRERELSANPENPRIESIKEAIYNLKASGYSYQDIKELFEKMDIQPTLTAHPTEVRRRTVLNKQKQIGQLLSEFYNSKIRSPEEQENIITKIYHQISLLFLEYLYYVFAV